MPSQWRGLSTIPDWNIELITATQDLKNMGFNRVPALSAQLTLCTAIVAVVINAKILEQNRDSIFTWWMTIYQMMFSNILARTGSTSRITRSTFTETSSMITVLSVEASQWLFGASVFISYPKLIVSLSFTHSVCPLRGKVVNKHIKIWGKYAFVCFLIHCFF